VPSDVETETSSGCVGSDYPEIVVPVSPVDPLALAIVTDVDVTDTLSASAAWLPSKLMSAIATTPAANRRTRRGARGREPEFALAAWPAALWVVSAGIESFSLLAHYANDRRLSAV
jgi:hypothetical protein